MDQLEGSYGLQAVLITGFVSACITLLFYQKKFFSLKNRCEFKIHLFNPLLLFSIFFFVNTFIPFLFYNLLLFSFKESLSSLSLMTLAQFGSALSLVLLLIVFSLIESKQSNAAIWFGRAKPSWTFFRKNIGTGVLTWTLCFPIALFFGSLTQFLGTHFWGILPQEQVAVQFLRLISESRLLTILTLFSILIVAPIIEEWVFRGYLQTYLKKKFKFPCALFLSSILFTLCHLSFSQGLSNIPLLVSLFSLAIFLGFLFEKQGNLIAPVTLHITFNSISVIRILF